ncbi:prolipoprotein diacylglyceryl transferase [Paenibacillus chondroitinus]|uniref:Prolipoprotein diacylglyceryl transferase n=1 Tax=Paenibacillus chondroitinus TaxID=59842 RepID=A0ABU6DJ19_9BACL|nr:MULTISPECIES: prolipoprotein diacylglyceryl transferase family protein [Paenibacillus]MCY9659587.1 prolipoprotein diacylglyceryl transferase [Paenibacillus anseongense]MEB4796983.1 prolipoprotein diacylglyceryl transferase [Paenibacillus chondroitinus]
MPDVLQLGPLQLQGKLIVVLLACAIGLWLIRRAARQVRSGEETAMTKSIDDIVFAGAVIVLITWKLGVIVTQPSLLWTSPLKLLMVVGSGTEIMLGLLLAAVYMYAQIRKQRIPLYVFLDILATGLTAAVFVYCALVPGYGLPTTWPWGISVEGTISRFHPFHAYVSLLLLPLLIWQIGYEGRRNRFGSGIVLKYSLMYGGASGMLASFFAAAQPELLYLSLAQLIFLFMLVLGMLLPALAHNTGRRELSAMSQNDSKTQIQQEQQNKEREKSQSGAGKEGFVDKKLDGPNRPST